MPITTVTPAEALTRLREGNERFISGARSVSALATQVHRAEHAAGQSPFATILTCSDSRVPAELIFDQGIGDLFVIRVAGNIIAPSLVGSVEFASATYGTSLVVVMGHTTCGAVVATLDVLWGRSQIASDNIRDIVERIRPAATTVLTSTPTGSEADLIDAAVRANVRASADHLRHGSRVLEEMVRHHQVVVVGAEYDLVTGRVDFFDVPEPLGA